MDPVTRRNMWRNRVEQCLASGMSKEEWCKLNNVGRASFYKWAAIFRKEEPGLFSEPNAQEWFELSREGIKRQVALAPATKRELSASTKNSQCFAGRANSAEDAATPMLRALVNGVEFAIPAGCAQSDLEAAFKAARS